MEHAQERGHIRALDGIRGVALIAVFVYHSLMPNIAVTSRPAHWLQAAATTGWAGVDLFFVLSGFLITTILLDARASDNYFKVFYIRRGLRILPLYYLVMIGAAALNSGHTSLSVWVFYWLNLSNLPSAFNPYVIPYVAHFWSLGIEEQFYLVWPSAVRMVRERTLAYICAFVIAGLFIVRNFPLVLALNHRWPDFIYRLTPFRIDTLCAGALLAIVVQRRPDLSRYRPLFRIVAAVSGLLFFHAAFGKLYTNSSVIRYGYTAAVLCFTSVIALAIFPGSFTARVFSNSFLRKTGKYSYCFYLVHPYFLDSMRGLTNLLWIEAGRLGFHALSHNGLVLAAASVEFFVIFGFCALSWTFVEGPLLRLKKHARYQPRPANYLA
jgi:peptidoglycan/LPS O-acetylase OafA/YrhL